MLHLQGKAHLASHRPSLSPLEVAAHAASSALSRLRPTRLMLCYAYVACPDRQCLQLLSDWVTHSADIDCSALLQDHAEASVCSAGRSQARTLSKGIARFNRPRTGYAGSRLQSRKMTHNVCKSDSVQHLFALVEFSSIPLSDCHWPRYTSMLNITLGVIRAGALPLSMLWQRQDVLGCKGHQALHKQ